MTKEELLELQQRLDKRREQDYEKVIAPFRKADANKIINNAYMIAHFNEIDDFISSLLCGQEEEDDLPISIELIEKILEQPKNIIEIVWYSWLGYNHQECYNFFDYEGLLDIIGYAWERAVA